MFKKTTRRYDDGHSTIPCPTFILNPKAKPIHYANSLQELIAQAKALLAVALSDDFADYDKATLFHYLGILSDCVDDIDTLVDALGLVRGGYVR